jgi:hypothetical protein
MHGHDQFGKRDAPFNEQFANLTQIGSEPVDILVEQVLQSRVKFAPENLHELGTIERAAVGKMQKIEAVPVL